MKSNSPQTMPCWLNDSLENTRESSNSTFQALESFVDKEVFHDNIHGSIWLNRVEVRIINTPEFQRLRWISQLAFAKYVFNSAEHSRFSHSIGAVHVSKCLTDTINEK